MKEEELEKMDKEELLGIIKAQKFEIERLNNIISELGKKLLEIGSDKNERNNKRAKRTNSKFLE